MMNIRNLSFSYDERPILEDFSLTVAENECVCIKAVSGKGKTTLLRLILGLETDFSGEIEVPKNISAVFQEDRLIEHLSLKRNILLAKDDAEKCDEMLKKVGLYDVRHKKVSQLSGGMKRRVAILRALQFGGDLLLLDEPFNGIDYENKKILAEIIKSEFMVSGKAVLLVTHITEDAELLGARIVEM